MLANSKTFLITRCTFVSCSNSKPIFYISTSSTTISHICASDFETKDESANNVDSFIRADTPDGSFLKFIYSTIIGNKKELNQEKVFNFAGTSHFLFQCNNISQIETKTKDNFFFFNFERLKCLTIQMNTFKSLKSGYIFRFGLGSLDTHDACFFGYSNVIDNYAEKAYIIKQSDQNSVMNFRECYFTSTGNFNTFIDTGSNNYVISIEDCYFDKQYSDLKSYSTNNLEFKSKRSNTLAHYTVQNICDGVNITKGAVCGDDKCLVENMGCDEDKFNFKDNEISYTFPGVDTEPPTLTFTSSSLFSPSGDFSRSTMFTESGDFTKSALFTETNDFTRSTIFTKTGDFTKSSLFTETGDFTQSTKFTESKKFKETSFFSESAFFTKSAMFTETEYFTKSSLFTETGDFTQSKKFTESKKFKETSFFSESAIFSKSTMFTQSTAFTETTDFTKSSFFSDSKKFSESNEFLKTNFFSESNDFTQTDDFTTSFYFTNTEAFSKTTQFTKSIDFSASNFFSSSHDFTESNGLNITDVFTPSNKFSSSNYFSSSFYFSNSHYFSSTLGFTKTDIFTLTKVFSKTNYFSLSIYFTESNEFSPSFVKPLTDSFIFSPSGTFIKKSDVVINIKTEEKSKISTGMKVGIGVSVGSAALAAIIVGLIFLRKKKYNQVEDMSEGIEIHEDFTTSNIHNNPLINIMNDDDPFEDEFI